MDDVIEFPVPPKRSDELFGASMCSSWSTVVVDGFEIPKLHARETDDGIVEVLIDRRMGYRFRDKDTAYLACALAANAMAIGEGYAWYGAAVKRRFAPEVRSLEDENFTETE